MRNFPNIVVFNFTLFNHVITLHRPKEIQYTIMKTLIPPLKKSLSIKMFFSKYSQNIEVSNILYMPKVTPAVTKVWVMPRPTWQGADEFINIFHVPFGRVTWQKVLCDKRQLPVVAIAMLWPSLPAWSMGSRAGHRHGWGRLLIAGHVWTLGRFSMTQVGEAWRGYWAYCCCLSAVILSKTEGTKQY